MKEIQGNGVSLLIQADALKAFLKKRNDLEKKPDAEEILSFMASQGVIYGVVEESIIQAFLDRDTDGDQPILVAKGSPRKDSKDAWVEYLFQEDFLGTGAQKEDGSIDFRDRGQMPMVNPGDVLARKHSPEEGVSGVNIFGEALEVFPAVDLDMRVGDGATLSEDKMVITAKDKGFPKKDMTGCVSVVQEYFISGDVGYKTGHVEFDGDVVVSGNILPGFRVKCHSLAAKAIEGAHITCEGDVNVSSGILESTVYSRGNLTAAYVTRSDITCLGHMDVVREILDSAVVLNGMCRVEKGRIISSEVTAREGVWVFNVGSTGARNASITAGVSKYAEQ